MSNHLIKQLDREVDSLQKALAFQVNVRDSIVEWLKSELKYNEPVINYSIYSGDKIIEKHEDNDIHVGRNECAESLLEMIKKWEVEDDE